MAGFHLAEVRMMGTRAYVQNTTQNFAARNARILKMREQGVATAEIARAYSLSKVRVNTIIRQQRKLRKAAST